MPERRTQPLEFRITRKGRHEATLEVVADPANPAELREVLRNWLTGNGWSRGRWGEFEAEAFAAGTSKRLARVRA